MTKMHVKGEDDKTSPLERENKKQEGGRFHVFGRAGLVAASMRW